MLEDNDFWNENKKLISAQVIQFSVAFTVVFVMALVVPIQWSFMIVALVYLTLEIGRGDAAQIDGTADRDDGVGVSYNVISQALGVVLATVLVAFDFI